MKTILIYIRNWIVGTIAIVVAFAALGITFGLSIAAIHVAANFGYSLL